MTQTCKEASCLIPFWLCLEGFLRPFMLSPAGTNIFHRPLRLYQGKSKIGPKGKGNRKVDPEMLPTLPPRPKHRPQQRPTTNFCVLGECYVDPIPVLFSYHLWRRFWINLSIDPGIVLKGFRDSKPVIWGVDFCMIFVCLVEKFVSGGLWKGVFKWFWSRIRKFFVSCGLLVILGPDRENCFWNVFGSGQEIRLKTLLEGCFWWEIRFKRLLIRS